MTRLNRLSELSWLSPSLYTFTFASSFPNFDGTVFDSQMNFEHPIKISLDGI